MMSSSWWSRLGTQPPLTAPRAELAAYLAHAQKCILASVDDGVLEVEWLYVPEIKLCVTRCSPTIEGRRIRVDAMTQTALAARYGARLPYAAEMDRLAKLAQTHVPPQTLSDGHQNAAPDMALPSAWWRQDALIDAWAEEHGGLVGLVVGEGKSWVLDGVTATRATNHGLYPLGGGRPIQVQGHAHDWRHVDYSQHGMMVYV